MTTHDSARQRTLYAYAAGLFFVVLGAVWREKIVVWKFEASCTSEPYLFMALAARDSVNAVGYWQRML